MNLFYLFLFTISFELMSKSKETKTYMFMYIIYNITVNKHAQRIIIIFSSVFLPSFLKLLSYTCDQLHIQTH